MTLRTVTYDDEMFALVPLEPTKAMIHAAAKCLSPDRRPTPEWLSVKEKHALRYRAMIDAAAEDLQNDTEST